MKQTEYEEHIFGLSKYKQKKYGYNLKTKECESCGNVLYKGERFVLDPRIDNGGVTCMNCMETYFNYC